VEMMWPERRGRAEGERKEAQAGTEESEGEREDGGRNGGEAAQRCPQGLPNNMHKPTSRRVQRQCGVLALMRGVAL